MVVLGCGHDAGVSGSGDVGLELGVGPSGVGRGAGKLLQVCRDGVGVGGLGVAVVCVYERRARLR